MSQINYPLDHAQTVQEKIVQPTGHLTFLFMLLKVSRFLKLYSGSTKCIVHLFFDKNEGIKKLGTAFIITFSNCGSLDLNHQLTPSHFEISHMPWLEFEFRQL